MQIFTRAPIEIPLLEGFTPLSVHKLYLAAEQVPRCDADEVGRLQEVYFCAGMLAMDGLVLGWEVPPVVQLRELIERKARFGPDDMVGPYIKPTGELMGGVAIYSAVTDAPKDCADIIPIDALYYKQRKRQGNSKKFPR